MAPIGSPSSRMSPGSARGNPEIVFANVDFPAPFAPSRVTISPSSSVKLTFCRTRLRPYPTETDLSSRSGMALASQIGLDPAAVRFDVRRRSPGDHGAGIDDDDLTRHIHHQRRVVLHDQNR